MNRINKDNVTELIKEVLEPEEVNINSLKMQTTLNPVIWDERGALRPEIRKQLLLNARRFIEFCDIESMKYNDIILTGSMANFNYNATSDIDIHIVLDFDQISDNEEFVRDYFKLKKDLWANKHDITIKGYDVEIYVQDTDEPHKSTGMYSLIKNEWIAKPLKKIVNIDTKTVMTKANDIMQAIDELGNIKDNELFYKTYTKFLHKLKNYRQAGLDTNGEYSVENLVFKILRNNGYLKKLIDEKNKRIDYELTLDQ
jgi:predicted nucleotidyltransferase